MEFDVWLQLIPSNSKFLAHLVRREKKAADDDAESSGVDRYRYKINQIINAKLAAGLFLVRLLHTATHSDDR